MSALTLADLSTVAAAHGVTIRADIIPRARRTALPIVRGAIRYRVAGGTAAGRAATARLIATACDLADHPRPRVAHAGRTYLDVYLPRKA